MHAYTNENIMGIIRATYCIHVQYINGNHFRIISTYVTAAACGPECSGK